MTRAKGTWLLLGVLAIALIVFPILNPSIVPPALANKVEDFGAYWSAAKVARTGENPYDAELLRPYETAIEPTRTVPIITWSPPWAIAVVVPFTLCDFPAARWIWMLLQLVGLAGCAAVVWSHYGGSPDRIGLAWLLAFTFYPTLQLIALGQMSLLTLAGIVGFLQWIHRRPFLAGASLGLVLVKPHNIIPFGVAVIIWIILNKNWRVVAGAILVILWTGAALAINPAFFTLYRETMSANPPGMMMPPTVGTLARMLLNAERGLWIQFIPTAIGAIWAVWYALRNRKEWNWQQAAPPLLFASVLCSPYGWIYDAMLLLVPILAVAARGVTHPLLWLTGYLSITAICVVNCTAGGQEVNLAWLPWLLFAGWWVNRNG